MPLITKQCDGIGCEKFFTTLYRQVRRCQTCRIENRPYKDGTINHRAKRRRQKDISNVERIKKMYGRKGKPTWEYRLRRQAKICNHCKQEKKLTLDHILPLSLGGKHTLSNVQMLCWDCHKIKDATKPKGLISRRKLKNIIYWEKRRKGYGSKREI